MDLPVQVVRNLMNTDKSQQRPRVLPYAHALLPLSHVVQPVLGCDPLHGVLGEAADGEKRPCQGTLRHLRQEVSLILDLMCGYSD